jgi:hypothetical protein
VHRHVLQLPEFRFELTTETAIHTDEYVQRPCATPGNAFEAVRLCHVRQRVRRKHQGLFGRYDEVGCGGDCTEQGDAENRSALRIGGGELHSRISAIKWFYKSYCKTINQSEQQMTFIMNNIGYIILAIGGLMVLSSSGSGKSKESEFDESAWYSSPENPCGPNYSGI